MVLVFRPVFKTGIRRLSAAVAGSIPASSADELTIKDTSRSRQNSLMA